MLGTQLKAKGRAWNLSLYRSFPLPTVTCSNHEPASDAQRSSFDSYPETLSSYTALTLRNWSETNDEGICTLLHGKRVTRAKNHNILLTPRKSEVPRQCSRARHQHCGEADNGVCAECRQRKGLSPLHAMMVRAASQSSSTIISCCVANLLV